jgi:RNA polymerase sigma-70 factor (ECF subfamily)
MSSIGSSSGLRPCRRNAGGAAIFARRFSRPFVTAVDVPGALRNLETGLDPAPPLRDAGRSGGMQRRGLAAGVSGGDGDELAALLEEHHAALLARALRLCADRDRARDLVQDTIERALRKRAAFVPGTNARAWLMTIMANLFVDQLRRRKVVVEVGLSAEDEVADERPAAAGGAELRITPEQLRAAVGALPVELRQVIDLHDLHGLAYKEIAERLAIPMGTVGTRLSRARSKLHAALRALAEDA